MNEFAEERVEIVGRGGQVQEEIWGESFVDGFIQFWHSLNGLRRLCDECAFKEAEFVAGKRYFDCVIDVCSGRQLEGMSDLGKKVPEITSQPVGFTNSVIAGPYGVNSGFGLVNSATLSFFSKT